MNNLKGIDVDIPLNILNVITGVSGSGKSSLIRGILYPALKRRLDEVADTPGEFASLDGDWTEIKHVEMVNQSPIGKSSRSNPVTYVKAFDDIRQLLRNNLWQNKWDSQHNISHLMLKVEDVKHAKAQE